MELRKILPYTILFISISSILQWCSLPIANTFVWWTLQSVILFLFIKLHNTTYKNFPNLPWIFYNIWGRIHDRQLLGLEIIN